MTPGQIAARSRGGQSRAKKYTHEQLVEWSSLGGRPSRQSLIRLHPAPEAKISIKEEQLASASYNKLMGLVKQLYPEQKQFWAKNRAAPCWESINREPK